MDGSGTNDEEPSNTVDMSNTSQVDVGEYLSFEQTTRVPVEKSVREDETQKFPLHAEAEYLDTILAAGQCLYIPPGWWHYVRSLEVSCSVSFWWD